MLKLVRSYTSFERPQFASSTVDSFWGGHGETQEWPRAQCFLCSLLWRCAVAKSYNIVELTAALFHYAFIHLERGQYFINVVVFSARKL